MKAYLRKDEIPDGIASSISGKHEIEIKHGIGYEYMYNQEDEFFLIVDDVLYPETSTAFDFQPGYFNDVAETVESCMERIIDKMTVEFPAWNGTLGAMLDVRWDKIQKELTELIVQAIENGTVDNQDE